jgi:hypothetical protein
MFHNFTVEFKDDIMEIVKMNEDYGELMQILHSECEKCPLRLSCIEEKCSVFRIEKSIQKEIEGEEND